MNFVVVSLGPQIYAVARHTQGWTKNDILNWLQQFGEINTLEIMGNAFYCFRSVSSCETCFRLNENNQFILAGEDTIIDPNKKN